MKISKERLEEIRDFDTCVTLEESAAMARQLLASMEQEPVAWEVKGILCHTRAEANVYVGEQEPLYAAPQLSQPEVAAPLAIHDEDFEKALSVLNDTLDDCGDSERGLLLALDKAGIEVRSDACRAAMLQSGNFRENKNSSTNYPVIPSEVLSAILKVAKIRADFDDFDGDRRGTGDCLDEAEQELIVTINKYASQLAAEPIATNDVREQTAIPPVPVIQADVAQAIEKLKRKLVECNRYNYCADAVKGVEYACRAAMLQGAKQWIPCSERMPMPAAQRQEADNG